MRIPYTYHLYNRVTDQHYYGVRYGEGCHPSDLWVTYFSSSKHVKKLIKEHGIDSFDYEVRQVFDDPIEAIEWETKVLIKLKVRQRTDWLNRIDQPGPTDPRRPRSPEHRQKISENNKKRVPFMLGRKRTDEWKKLMSERFGGERNNMYGKKHTPEARAKITAAQTGRKYSEDSRKKMSLAAKAQNRDMARLRSLKKPISAETRKKMSDAQFARFERERKQKEVIDLHVVGQRGGTKK